MLGVSQDVAHDASTKVPQSLILRARECLSVMQPFLCDVVSCTSLETRKTYRAVFSEPKVVIPAATRELQTADVEMKETQADPAMMSQEVTSTSEAVTGKKRALEGGNPGISHADIAKDGVAKKKKKKNKSSS